MCMQLRMLGLYLPTFLAIISAEMNSKSHYPNSWYQNDQIFNQSILQSHLLKLIENLWQSSLKYNHRNDR